MDKKSFLLILTLLVGAIGWFVFSCGDDDDNDDNDDSGTAADDDNDDNQSDDDNGDDDTQGPSIVDTQTGSCKDGSGAGKEDWPQDLVFSYEGGILTVTHVNAVFNCCLERVDVTLEISGNVIRLDEVEYTPEPCWCECPFDVATRIAGLAPGTYTVEAWVNGALAITESTVIPE
ncbi:MAG: hypothetical protein GX444_17050 [Myxococcales bacterium]|nr:hypothetical protein [Myxococcales bacterium]